MSELRDRIAEALFRNGFESLKWEDAAAITGIRIQRDGDSYRMADAVIDAIRAAADAAEREP